MAKRFFDVVFGGALALLALPAIFVLTIVVALQLRTWKPIFVQERIGRRGRPFLMLKLRTLPVSTPRYALKTTLRDLEIPPFLRFLRRTHLDELPQLFLVPIGRLSLVGPRPKMPDRFEQVDSGYAIERVRVRQGCTGLWQISPDQERLPHESPEYDEFYVARRTLLLDCWILWRTALLMLRLDGPVALDEIPSWATSEPRRRRAATPPVVSGAAKPLHLASAAAAVELPGRGN